ncbi:hypothetical protein DXA68_05450 [Bacteroides stercorirosoris]|uniref:Uncharacterized protein n=1 Tax=Bacteroides stercorirosoris TaxID=871324 RepID=A0A413H977_9BACE|nr:hypothetical protein DXA68_05450 [Bacteroides stercorirosoris]
MRKDLCSCTFRQKKHENAHFSAVEMPYFALSNATLKQAKCHISVNQMPHSNTHQVWHSACLTVAFGLLRCGILRVFL